MGLAGKCGGVNHACGLFQIPIAAQVLVARGVVGRGDVGLGQFAEFFNEGDAAGASGEVAAVEQNVGVLTQRGLPGLGELCGIGSLQVVEAELDVAQAQVASAGVGQNMQGVNVALLRQCGSDFGYAVFARFNDGSDEAGVGVSLGLHFG